MGMDAEDRQLAEAVLKHLCVDAQIGGVQFGAALYIMLMNHTDRQPPIISTVWLCLGSRWMISDSVPLELPESESDLPEMSVDEQLRTICSIREQRVTEAILGDPYPH